MGYAGAFFILRRLAKESEHVLTRRIEIGEYDIDVKRLLERRLHQTAHPFTLIPDGENVIAELNDPGGLDALSIALALLLCRDLCQCELAKLVNRLPLTLVEKQAVLSDAIRCARKVERPGAVRRALKTYLEEEESLHLSGYMRFRMPDTMNSWKLCVQSASEELLLEKEYLELMGVLRAFVQVKPTRIREVSLLLHPDGSCTLTDESDARIDCDAGSDPDRLISMLVDLAPERLTVYDLSSAQDSELTEMLARVFAGRVRFVR